MTKQHALDYQKSSKLPAVLCVASFSKARPCRFTAFLALSAQVIRHDLQEFLPFQPLLHVHPSGVSARCLPHPSSLLSSVEGGERQPTLLRPSGHLRPP